MTTWKIDNMHSQVQFKVKHLVVSTVSGEFKKFDATVESSKDDFTDAKITFEADVDSISTGQEQRDGHLKSDDFFNAASYPKIKFISKEVKKEGEHYKVIGDLTIRDKTHAITLDVSYGGTAVFSGTPNAPARIIAGFEIRGKISRKEYGLKWNMATETGGMVVSDEVKIEAAVELVKQG